MTVFATYTYNEYLEGYEILSFHATENQARKELDNYLDEDDTGIIEVDLSSKKKAVDVLNAALYRKWPDR